MKEEEEEERGDELEWIRIRVSQPRLLWIELGLLTFGGREGGQEAEGRGEGGKTHGLIYCDASKGRRKTLEQALHTLVSECPRNRLG